MKFKISDKDMKKIKEWDKKQNKKTGTNHYGAIGGHLTYSFTPTGLGCVFTVTHGATKAELDLTDYDW